MKCLFDGWYLLRGVKKIHEGGVDLRWRHRTPTRGCALWRRDGQQREKNHAGNEGRSRDARAGGEPGRTLRWASSTCMSSPMRRRQPSNHVLCVSKSSNMTTGDRVVVDQLCQPADSLRCWEFSYKDMREALPAQLSPTPEWDEIILSQELPNIACCFLTPIGPIASACAARRPVQLLLLLTSTSRCGPAWYSAITTTLRAGGSSTTRTK